MARATSTDTPRAKVRELAGVAPRLDVVYDPRTVFDFLVSIEGHGEHEKDPDLLPEDATWLRRARAEQPADRRAELDRYFGEDSIGLPYSLAGIAVEHPEAKDAAGFVRVLRRTSSEKLAARLLSGLLGMHGQLDLSAEIVAGDSDALDAACEPWDAAKRDKLTEFVGNRDGELDRMIGVLENWLPLYQEVESRVAGMLKRDVDARQQERAKIDGDTPTLVERTTGGLRWFPEPGVRRVILAPQYFGRPFNYIFNGTDWRMFAYPIAESALGEVDSALPPQTVVRLYRALGDTTRMRILRLLADRDWYLTELAQQVELSKPTMKHHLALLRAAGLVTVVEEGNLTYYSLRRERLREAGVELQHYIG